MSWLQEHQFKCVQATKAFRECAGALIAIADPRLQAELEDFAVRSHYLERKATAAVIYA
jgi:acyl-CoA hydrolase